MVLCRRLLSFLSTAAFLTDWAISLATTDAWRDADLGQSSYVGGNHYLDPVVVASPQFGELWKVDFNEGEKHYARPLVYTPPSTNKQIIFLASTENIIRTLDAETGNVLKERRIAEPFPMVEAFCSIQVSQTLGILGTPTIDSETDIAYFYAKSYIPNYRQNTTTGIYNGVYYFYAVDVNTLEDIEGFPLLLDGAPADNDPRRYFIGGTILQRPPVLQLGDVVYGAFGAMCDGFNLTGTLLGVDVKQKKVVTNWVTQAGPNSRFSDDWTSWHGGGPGGIWQSGQGLASDGNGIFFAVGEGGADIDNKPKRGNASVSILTEAAVHVKPRENGGVDLVDFFRPYNYQNDEGEVLGSGGVSILDPYFNSTSVARIGTAAGKSHKLYVFDLANLGGYRQGLDETDSVLQTIPIGGDVYGGVGSYPLEGGYIYVGALGQHLTAYKLNTTVEGRPQFFLAGQSEALIPEQLGSGIPTVSSYNEHPGTGIVWLTDATEGLRAWHAVPGEDGLLKQIDLPRVNGAMKYSRPAFGDRKVYVINAEGSVVCLGVKA